MMLVDSHCHLDFPDFATELDAVVARAKAGGIGLMLTIGTKLSEVDGVLAVAERFPDVWCTVGIHPHEAEAEPMVDAERLVALTRHPKVVGIGETGLDYFYEHSPRAAQERNFRTHIEAARATGLPLIVHTRDADADTARILSEEQKRGAFKGVIHCFSSGAALAQTALELGFYISFSGIVTFKKAENVRAVARSAPRDRLLVETDSPYLAPVPHRGKRNEPAFVADTARQVAALQGMPLTELAAVTSDNFFRLFDKVVRPEGVF
jgi:TatD DNase family protein